MFRIIYRFFSLFIFFTAAALYPKSASATQKDLAILRERIMSEILSPEVNEQQVSSLLSSLKADGTWPDIIYDSFSRTAFDQSRHMSNMLTLARAYRKPGTKYFRSAEVKNAIISTLDLWLKNDFIAGNWHTNEIAGPGIWSDVLYLAGPDLDKKHVDGLRYLAGRANLNAWGARPANDLIAIAGIMAKVAIYDNDEDKFRRAMDAIRNEIHITSGKGVKSDMSFHHRHDRVTSVLSYGTGYVGTYAQWLFRLQGTSYSFPEEATRLVTDYFLDGICKTMVYGKYPDPGAMNRSMSGSGALKAKSADVAEELLAVSSYRKDELEKIRDIRNGIKKPDLVSNSFFWHSEYQSHQRPQWFASVRMHSNRQMNMEAPHNSESTKHHHYADGGNFISVTGEEYYDIFPVLDWMKIPGTTVVQKPELPGPGEIVKQGLTGFVGGVTDGKYGASAFDFRSPHDPLSAKKAWFMFDDEIVCLGNSIHSESPYPVATTLNQSLLSGDVIYSSGKKRTGLEKGTHELKDIRWVWHANIAYLFPGPQNVNLNNTVTTGSWYDIRQQLRTPREKISREVFKLWFDHGIKPGSGSYEYIILPAVKADAAEAYSKNPSVRILSNTAGLQAVVNKKLSIIQAVYYIPGELKAGDITLTAMQPGIAMMKLDGDRVVCLTVSDPTRKLYEMHFRLSQRIEGGGEHWRSEWNSGEKYSDLFIGLPGGDYAGKSITIDPEKSYPGTPYSTSSPVKPADKIIRTDQKYHIGQKFGGGIIFYVDETGEHGLIAAEKDLDESVAWRSGPSKISHAAGDHGDKVTNARASGIGAGLNNTAIIISQLTEDNPFTPFAAKICSEYQGGGYGDWYLPSKNELELLYDQRNLIGNFDGFLYWSSTEYNVGFAWGINFLAYGGRYAYNKSTQSNVRCIRRF